MGRKKKYKFKDLPEVVGPVRDDNDPVVEDNFVAMGPSTVLEEPVNNKNYDYLFNENAIDDKTEKCERCILRSECELNREYKLLVKTNTEESLLHYKFQELENCTMYYNFTLKPCGTDKVADGIEDDFKIDIVENYKTGGYRIATEDDTDKWVPENPIFISAQTGQGKNYFIENTLLPYIRNLNIKKRTNQRVLIISNRTALRLQIENRIKNENAVSHYANYDFADVITYQGLLGFVDHLADAQKEKYLFVVCDEAHFFTSDAMFNPNTEKILRTIVNTFKEAIRIYMSATPYECLGYIEDHENRAYKYPKGRIQFYHFKRDYSYLDIKYYSNERELIDIILNIENEKWLIFIDNKDRCKKYKEMLETGDEGVDKTKQKKSSGLKGKVFTIDADSKDNEHYQYIVAKETLDNKTKVLISTSVLDNGVNIRGIHNIVVSDISKVKLLQMVGRARVGNNSRITLYIKRLDENYMERIIRSLERQQDAYHDYDLASETRKDTDSFLDKYYFNANIIDWKNARQWFARTKREPKIPQIKEIPDRIYLNSIAYSMVHCKLDIYKNVLEDMKKANNEQELHGQKLLEYQLSWFGKTYNKNNDITLVDGDESIKEIITFLEKYIGRKMNDDEQKMFRSDFTQLHDKLFGSWNKNKTHDDYGASVIKKILTEHDIDYDIKSQRSEDKKRTYWEIVKLNLKAETPESK